MVPDRAQSVFIRQSLKFLEGDISSEFHPCWTTYYPSTEVLVTASDVAVSQEKTQKNKIKSLIGFFIAVAFWSVPPLAQEKNEVGGV